MQLTDILLLNVVSSHTFACHGYCQRPVALNSVVMGPVYGNCTDQVGRNEGLFRKSMLPQNSSAKVAVQYPSMTAGLLPASFSVFDVVATSLSFMGVTSSLFLPPSARFFFQVSLQTLLLFQILISTAICRFFLSSSFASSLLFQMFRQLQYITSIPSFPNWNGSQYIRALTLFKTLMLT